MTDNGQKIILITLDDDPDTFLCDEDGYVLFFDDDMQVLSWARHNDINPDTITMYEAYGFPDSYPGCTEHSAEDNYDLIDKLDRLLDE